MYGARMAADGWQEEYSTFLVSLGFRQGDACPNLFYHSGRKVVTSVHGDDFTSSGPADALDWLEEMITKQYEISIEPRLGPGPLDAKESRVLNRVIRWCDDCIEYEADPRQVERLVAECGLQGAKPCSYARCEAHLHRVRERYAAIASARHTLQRGVRQR